MADFNVLSDKDVRHLKDRLSYLERQVQNMQYRRGNTNSSVQSTDIYLAKVPVGGIPARVGTVCGAADCEIYRSVYNGSTSVLEAMPGNTQRVLNIFSTAIAVTDVYVPIGKDKSGSWSVLARSPTSSSAALFSGAQIYNDGQFEPWSIAGTFDDIDCFSNRYYDTHNGVTGVYYPGFGGSPGPDTSYMVIPDAGLYEVSFQGDFVFTRGSTAGVSILNLSFTVDAVRFQTHTHSIYMAASAIVRVSLNYWMRRELSSGDVLRLAAQATNQGTGGTCKFSYGDLIDANANNFFSVVRIADVP